MNDEWSSKPEWVFLEKNQVKKLFENFDIVCFDEIEKDSLTGMGKMKHWHVFDVIARKK